MEFSNTPHLVSVVIPCFRQAHYLGEAIESVRCQTHRHVEIIVVNDGSTDNTVEVATSFEGVRCFSQPNRGRALARNKGLELASGAYVVFLDADDRILPHALEIALGHFENHPDAAFVAGQCVCIGGDGNDWRPPVVHDDHYTELLRTNFIWTPANVMFRTALVREAGGFDADRALIGAEDYELYLRIARGHRIFCHDCVVAEYRQHDTNTSRNFTLMLSSTMNVMRRQHRWVKDTPRAERARREGIRRWQEHYGGRLVNTMRRQVRAGDWRQAIPAMVALLQNHPSSFVQHASRKIYRMCLGHKPEAADAIGWPVVPRRGAGDGAQRR